MLEEIPDTYRIVKNRNGNYSVQEKVVRYRWFGRESSNWFNIDKLTLRCGYGKDNDEFVVHEDAVKALYDYVKEKENKVTYPQVVYVGKKVTE